MMPISFDENNFYQKWDNLIKDWLNHDQNDQNRNPLIVLNDGTLSTQHLPEPYYGNMDCSIVIINLNPGIGLCEQCLLRKDVPDILVNDVLNNSYSGIAKDFPIGGVCNASVHMPTESLNWWISRLEWIDRILVHRLGENADGKPRTDKKPFAIELVPLHSKSFKVSNAATYIKDKYQDIINVIDYAIGKSEAQMGLAVGKPIYDVLLKNHGYYSLFQMPKKPKPTTERYYDVIRNPSGRLILCTWSHGSNKAPSKDFKEDEKLIIDNALQMAYP